MIRSPGQTGCTSTVLMLMIAWTAQAAVARPADDPPTDPTKSYVTQQHSDAKGNSTSTDPQVWSCAMHPQIRQPERGRCPICSMELVATGEPSGEGRPRLMSLQEMLAIALKHNPDVRAADARLHSFKAELDQTRWEVVQRIIGYREKWQSQQLVVWEAERELAEAGRQQKLAKEGVIAPRLVEMAAAAKEKVDFQRRKLAEIETELPFLLGTAPAQANRLPDSKARRLIRHELLPKARQMLELQTREYVAGNANISELAAGIRQTMEFEMRLAETGAKRIAVVESWRKRLHTVHSMAVERYRSGNTTQGDVLFMDLERSKLDLWLSEHPAILNGP